MKIKPQLNLTVTIDGTEVTLVPVVAKTTGELIQQNQNNAKMKPVGYLLVLPEEVKE